LEVVNLVTIKLSSTNPA